MKKLSLQRLTASFILAIVLLAPFAVSSAEKAKQGKVGGAAQGSAPEGQAVFQKNCNMCHFPDKTDKKIGPGLKDLFKNKELPQSHKETTETNVREQIEKGSKAMPAFAKKLTLVEMENLLAYLKTL